MHLRDTLSIFPKVFVLTSLASQKNDPYLLRTYLPSGQNLSQYKPIDVLDVSLTQCLQVSALSPLINTKAVKLANRDILLDSDLCNEELVDICQNELKEVFGIDIGNLLSVLNIGKGNILQIHTDKLTYKLPTSVKQAISKYRPTTINSNKFNFSTDYRFPNKAPLEDLCSQIKQSAQDFILNNRNIFKSLISSLDVKSKTESPVINQLSSSTQIENVDNTTTLLQIMFNQRTEVDLGHAISCVCSVINCNPELPQRVFSLLGWSNVKKEELAKFLQWFSPLSIMEKTTNYQQTGSKYENQNNDNTETYYLKSINDDMMAYRFNIS
jgi:hypothetical protein